jgi:excisionase family DNA binding protein
MELAQRLAYSLDESAELIGVTRRHLEHEAARGYLRTIRSGGRRLASAAALREYLAACEDSEQAS